MPLFLFSPMSILLFAYWCQAVFSEFVRHNILTTSGPFLIINGTYGTVLLNNI